MISRNKDTANAYPHKWVEIITPSHPILALNLKELYNYRDLLLIWMRRDILAIYTQTILGPLWFFLQPILTTGTYIIIFSRIAHLPTINLPPFLFYMSGIIFWAYFSECILKTSSFLKDNTPLFAKVYFPRLIIPLSIVLTTLVKFGIQFGLFCLVFFYFYWRTDLLHPNFILFSIPLLIFLIALLGLGCGLIVASLTTRYKDLAHLTTFAVQLLQFLSPVFFPVSSMPDGFYKRLILANPMTGIIEAFRYGFTGQGYMSIHLLLYDAAVTIFLLFAGIILFNRIEKTFVDII